MATQRCNTATRWAVVFALAMFVMVPGQAAADILCPVTAPTTFSGFQNFNSFDCTITATGNLTVDSPGDVRIQSSRTLTNLGTLTNNSTGDGATAVGVFIYGLRVDGGNLVNSSTLDNTSTGAIFVAAGRLTNTITGSLSNAGQLSTLGTLQNDGSWVNELGGQLRLITNVFVSPPTFATMSNSGFLSNSGFISIDPGSTLSNSGTLNNSGSVSFGGTFSNTGIFNTTTFGLLSINGFLLNEAGGTLNNRAAVGFASNNAELHNKGGAGAGTKGAEFNNFTSFQNRSLFVNSAGSAGGGAAVLNNFGTFDNSDAGGSALQNGGIVSNSGTFKVASGTTVNGTGTFNQTAGTTTVNGTITQDTFNCMGGIVNGGGTITTTASGVLGGFSIQRDCTVSPFNSIGTLTLDGGAAGIMFDGELDIEIAGLGSYDVLKVLGGIHFGSNAKIKFIFEGYTPQQGDAFHFLDADIFDGFGNLSFLFEGLGGGYAFRLADAGNGNLDLFTALAPTNGDGGGNVSLPGTLLLGLLGLGVLGLARVRRLVTARRLAGGLLQHSIVCQ